MDVAETADFWMGYSIEDLSERCAALHKQRRELIESHGAIEVEAVRRAISSMWIKGKGVEVGAGSRPFFIPKGSECYYGDIRDKVELSEYFSNLEVAFTGFIDAQTMAGVPDASIEFVISAHVIEHLFDPIGAILNTFRVLKQSGIFLVVVPEKSKTWDRLRPVTTLEHLKLDYTDGGVSTKRLAYLEHAKFVHPVLTGSELTSEEIEDSVERSMLSEMDVHVHCWKLDEFEGLLAECNKIVGFKTVQSYSIQNENIFVLQKI